MSPPPPSILPTPPIRPSAAPSPLSSPQQTPLPPSSINHPRRTADGVPKGKPRRAAKTQRTHATTEWRLCVGGSCEGVAGGGCGWDVRVLRGGGGGGHRGAEITSVMDTGPCTAPRRRCRSRRRSGAETTSVTVVGGRAAGTVAASSSRERGGSRVVAPGGERACVGGDGRGWGARGVGGGTLASGCRGGDCCRPMPIGSRLPCCGRRDCHRAVGRACRWGGVPGGKGVHPTGAPPPGALPPRSLCP